MTTVFLRQVRRDLRTFFYYGGGYNYDSSVIRPRYEHSTTYVTTRAAALHCGQDEYNRSA